ncbi:hypothetical protein [Rhizobium leguminosarum]|uniref:hypothetical protein n=1 Tax=Rhizobium leguminosarum TaxID=384 RepID=UPI00035DF9D2|nr:hypothetical protein [Rhizobium leguminosarum]
MSLIKVRDKSKTMLFREPGYRLKSVVTAVPLPSYVEHKGKTYSTHISRPVVFSESGAAEYHYDLRPVHDVIYEMEA